MICRYKVAILMAVHNGEKFLPEQVESILNQNNVDITLFVRLDNCSDSSFEILSLYAKNFSNVMLLNSEKVYGSAAANFLSMLRDFTFQDYSFVAFADQDDIWLENKCITAIKRLNDNNAYGYSSNLIAFTEEKEWLLNKFGIQKKYDYLFQGASAGCTYVLSSVLVEHIQSHLFKVSRQNDKNISHDWLVYAIARNGGFSWVISDDALIKYRQHQNNVYSANSGFKGLLFRLNLLLDDWYYENIINISNYLVLNNNEKEIIDCIHSKKWFCRFSLFLKACDFRREHSYALVLSFLLLFKIV
jgi:rhamnosyltransferase